MVFSWEEQSLNARAASAALDASSSSSTRLVGGRAVAVARLVSLAPVGARLTPRCAGELLCAHGWRLRDALRALRAEMAAADPSQLVPAARDAARLRNLANAGNSCYLGAVIAALFPTWDAWDGLLAHRRANEENLRATLREAVCRVRRGERVSESVIEAIRSALRARGFRTGKGQEDAAEAFVFLVDALGAPYLPLGERLLHGAATNDPDDTRFASERLLWLSLREGDAERSPREPPRDFRDLLKDYFFGDRLEGVRRNQSVVDAWRHRHVLPYYTPEASTGEVATMNDASAFSTVSLPFALKRFDAYGRKARARVSLPTRIPFSDYVDGVNRGSYSLVLRSVVCHLGDSLSSGHYIAHTYDPYNGTGWRRWNDLSRSDVECTPEGRLSSEAREELERDAYIVFYELVEGDGTTDPRDAFFHVPDVDPRSLSDDDQSFAKALQRMEFEDFWRR